jgi:integrase
MRERRLEEGEELRIYLKARKSKNGRAWIRLISLTLETAMRAQEILFARWKDISFQSGIWHIPRKHSKTGKSRQVPLTARAIRLLKEQKPTNAKPEDRVFSTWRDTRTMGLTFQRICTRAGVLDFRFHDLRHTSISRYVAEGHPPAVLMKITGHSKYITFERYVNLTDNELVGTVAKGRDAKRASLRLKPKNEGLAKGA